MCKILRKTITLLVLNLILEDAVCMTREQLKETMNGVKKQCVPKNGVTEDQVSNIEQGVFNEDPKVMCYVSCIYKSIAVVKDDRLNVELAMKQIDALYPPDMKTPVKDSVQKCIPTQDKYSDPCEGIFNAAKCLYETDPNNFVFP